METIKWLNDLCISEVNFVNIHKAPAKVYPMRNKGRRHHGLVFTLENTEVLAFDGMTLELVPWSVVYIPKGAQYNLALKGENSHDIFIDFELASESHHPPFRIKFDEGDPIKTHFQDAEKIWQKNSASRQASLKAQVYKILAHMIRKSELYLTPDGYSKISSSVKYLHEHYLESDFKVASLSEMSGISQRYYEKLFERKFGATPKEYILGLKIERAKALLLGENSLVKNIALELGYADVYHFGKIFKEKTGYTPTEFKKENLK
jgi:iron complex transport system substrate-binding protein